MKDFDVDNRDIEMLRLRCAGVPPATVAQKLGVSASSVMNRCSNIRKADLAMSGEDPDAVRAGYW